MDMWMIYFGIMAAAFVCEYVDSTLGMGYGTILAPLLLTLGFAPLAIVPAILVSELLTGAVASFGHSLAGNVSFDFSRDSEHRIVKRLGKLGYLPKSGDSKVAMVLAACSMLGSLLAVFIAVNLPKMLLRVFIGLIVLAMGIIILARHRASPRFSWRKIVGLGAVASFNKGISGGGYGPLVTSGQILSGVRSKSSVAITSFSESFTCLVAVLGYLLVSAAIDWSIAPFLVIGALASTPLSVLTVRKANTVRIGLLVGVSTLILGAFTLIKVFW
jgi:uncharacterized membrane protein YfcA